LIGVPKDFVVVEVGGRVEPESESLLSATLAVDVDVGLKSDGLPFFVSQELEIQFVMLICTRRQLHNNNNNSNKNNTKIFRIRFFFSLLVKLIIN
jgi:hypothetical protein